MVQYLHFRILKFPLKMGKPEGFFLEFNRKSKDINKDLMGMLSDFSRKREGNLRIWLI